jgi:hypothetical protein
VGGSGDVVDVDEKGKLYTEIEPNIHTLSSSFFVSSFSAFRSCFNVAPHNDFVNPTCLLLLLLHNFNNQNVEGEILFFAKLLNRITTLLCNFDGDKSALIRGISGMKNFLKKLKQMLKLTTIFSIILTHLFIVFIHISISLTSFPLFCKIILSLSHFAHRHYRTEKIILCCCLHCFPLTIL